MSAAVGIVRGGSFLRAGSFRGLSGYSGVLGGLQLSDLRVDGVDLGLRLVGVVLGLGFLRLVRSGGQTGICIRLGGGGGLQLLLQRCQQLGVLILILPQLQLQSLLLDDDLGIGIQEEFRVVLTGILNGSVRIGLPREQPFVFRLHFQHTIHLKRTLFGSGQIAVSADLALEVHIAALGGHRIRSEILSL